MKVWWLLLLAGFALAGCSLVNGVDRRACVELIERAEFARSSTWVFFDVDSLSGSEAGRAVLTEASPPPSADAASGSRCTGLWIGSGAAVLRQDGSIEVLEGMVSSATPQEVDQREPRAVELLAASGDLGMLPVAGPSAEIAISARIRESSSEFVVVWDTEPQLDRERMASEMRSIASSLGEISWDWEVTVGADGVRLDASLPFPINFGFFQALAFPFSEVPTGTE